MNAPKKIYLDYNATTPVDPRVVEEMLPYFTEIFGNASSINHAFGWDAEEAVDVARDQIARLIGATSKEIYFTSGATEAINIALLGICNDSSHHQNHIITCVTEHKAVLDTCKELEKRGFEVTYLPVDPSGSIDLNQLEESITEKTRLVCLMHANNETGVIHPIEKIAAISKEHKVLFFTDATQSVGKITFDCEGIDFAAFSAHKLYGPKGVGALYIRNGLRQQIHPSYFGGGQEKGIRPGTLNVPGIVGFGKACELCYLEMNDEASKLEGFVHKIEQELLKMEGVRINGAASSRLPHTTNITFENIDGSRLIRSLKKLALSQGSACTSATVEPSHVLLSLGLNEELSLSSIRIGLGRFTTEQEVEITIQDLKNVVDQLKLIVS